jgi:hypothetical protein
MGLGDRESVIQITRSLQPMMKLLVKVSPRGPPRRPKPATGALEESVPSVQIPEEKPMIEM